MTSLGTVGAIGDIHEEDVRLAAALAFLARAKVDRILAVGDIVDGPGDALRCCELLKEYGVDGVMGNHDRWLLGDIMGAGPPAGVRDPLRDYLESLPPTREYETAAGSLLLCHGLGNNDMNKLLPDDFGYALESNDELQELLATQQYRFVINGHSHRRMVRDFGGVTVINVGTLFREHEPGFGLIDFGEGTVTFYAVDGAGEIRESSTGPL